MAQRGSLDSGLQQVPSNRSRKILLPTIDKNCLDSNVFCSDGWKAYHKLKEHLQLEDCDNYAVNHSVDLDTGAHTQTIEGLWGHTKGFLPMRGMKPCDLHSYLGWFMWSCFYKQRNLDKFVHFFKCVCDIRPPSNKQTLPIGVMFLESRC